MPGTNAGTGKPIVFWCAKCRRDKTDRTPRPGHEATGRIKPLTSAQQGHGGCRVLSIRVEYRCFRCGHTGWSRHSDMRRLLRRYLENKPLAELRELHAGGCPRGNCKKGGPHDWQTCAWHQVLGTLIDWKEKKA